MSGVKLSEAIEGGMDVEVNSITRKPGGGCTGDLDAWQLAMTYAVLQELKGLRAELEQLNATLGCYRVTRGMDALHSIDRRLAKKIPHRKRKAKP